MNNSFLKKKKLYKSLDIATNKATVDEMKNIPHHLIGYLDSTYIKSNVIDYRNNAVQLVIYKNEMGKRPKKILK